MNKSIRHALRIAQEMGRGSDTILAHINPREAKLLKKYGGSGKINPKTGLLEFDDEGRSAREGDNPGGLKGDTGGYSERSSESDAASNAATAQQQDKDQSLREANDAADRARAGLAEMDRVFGPIESPKVSVPTQQEIQNDQTEPSIDGYSFANSKTAPIMANPNSLSYEFQVPDTGIPGAGLMGKSTGLNSLGASDESPLMGYRTAGEALKSAAEEQANLDRLAITGFDPNKDLFTSLNGISPSAAVSASSPTSTENAYNLSNRSPNLSVAAGTPTSGYDLARASGTPTSGYDLARAAGTPTSGYDITPVSQPAFPHTPTPQPNLAVAAGTPTEGYNVVDKALKIAAASSPGVTTPGLPYKATATDTPSVAKSSGVSPGANDSSRKAAGVAPTGETAPPASTDEANQKYLDMMKSQGFDSEDPVEIAKFNAINNLSGPKSLMGEEAVGQRATPEDSLLRKVEDLIAPKFVGVNDPNYEKVASATDPIGYGPNGDMTRQEYRENYGHDPVEPLRKKTDSSQKDATKPPPSAAYPVAQYQYPLAYGYDNPYAVYNQYGNAINWGMVPTAATGGRISNNNAIANALRMIKARNRP